MDEKIANLFKEAFSGYEYCFETADSKIQQLTDEERQRYLLALNEFEKSGALENEVAELTKHFYKEIATTLTDNVQITAYRITLLFIQKFEKRMKYLASLYKSENPKVESEKIL